MEEFESFLTLAAVPLFDVIVVFDDALLGLKRSTLTALPLLIGVDELFSGIVFNGLFWGVSSDKEKKFSFADDEYSLLL